MGMSKSYQVNELFDALTVRQNILMSVLGQKRGSFRFDALASLNGVSGYGGQVGAAMDLVELSHKADTPVHELRSEEHTSELQSLMRISYAVSCLKKKKA